VNAQLAARAIGSEVGFFKTYMRTQWFHIVPHARSTVFAANATLGLADPFSRDVVQPDGSVVPVIDLPASERFYAGGDTTVRGFAQDQLGVTEGPDATIDPNTGFPIGGNGLVILNAELRVPYHSLQFVTFADAGNVFARPTLIDLSELRSSVGIGIRYKSPVGPIRVDLGFKIHRQVVVGVLESLTAIHISLGQAF
jgi:outer membrane protein assembly factor BamA